MKTLNKILNKTWNWIKENPKKTILEVGLAGLIATTAIKDNVYFESVKIINPQGNHYIFGIFPTTRIEGKEGKGNIYTFGLLYGRTKLEDNSKLSGSMNSYVGIIGVNEIGNNSEIEKSMNSYAGIFGGNDIGNNSEIGKSMNSCAGILGMNYIGNGSEVKENISNKGIFAYNSNQGFGLFSNGIVNEGDKKIK